MPTPDLHAQVDRAFMEAWFAQMGDHLDNVPETEDGLKIASLLCQMGVLAQLQERSTFPEDTASEEGAEDFAMELVQQLWPLFPPGAKRLVKAEGWERLLFVPWSETDSVHHNIRAAAERRELRRTLHHAFESFPSLTEADKDALLVQPPALRALGAFLSERETSLGACLPSRFWSEFFDAQVVHQLGSLPILAEVDRPALTLFQDLRGSLFAALRSDANKRLPLLLLHRACYAVPPKSSHQAMLDWWFAQPTGSAVLEETRRALADLQIPAVELEQYLAKATFLFSYEAAYQLCMSEGFLKRASGRSARDRNRSGFHFWLDLRNPAAVDLATTCLEWLSLFVENALPLAVGINRAELLAGAPLCWFLELIRVGDVPEEDLSRVRNAQAPVGEAKRLTEPSPAPALPVPPRPAGQRVIRVFVSSTFRDMHGERNELNEQVFPRLRKLCEDRGVAWSEIDLRWGITEKQAQRGEVLPICLAEIERCRPYFIGLLGDRYGWIPENIPDELIAQQPWLDQHKERSVTELEILHGVLHNPAMANRACFYFRDPAYAERLPPEEKSDFQEEDPHARKRLAALKDRIRVSGLALRENYPDPRALGELVLRDLTTAINQQYPPETSPSPLDREAAAHEAVALSQAGVYVGRRECFNRLDAHVADTGPPLTILGESGLGKSALLANWALRHREQHPEDLVLLHFVGASAASTDWTALMGRLLGELKRHLGIERDIPDQLSQMQAEFGIWLALAGERKRVILILDGLNQFEDREGALDLGWLPATLPAKVRVLCSTLPGRPLDEIRRRAWPTYELQPLTLRERLRLLGRYLRRFGKRLSKPQRRRIIASPQCGNPLILRILLEELRLFGVFDQLDERIDHYLRAPTILRLIDLILERYEAAYERDRHGLVGEALALLCSARKGLTEAELLDLLGRDGKAVPAAYWSPLYVTLDKALINRAGLIDFAHEYLREAVARRYLPDGELRRQIHLRLAEYFQGKDRARRLDELPWQLAQAGAWDRLVQLLGDGEFLHQARLHDSYSLKCYWTEIESQSVHRMVDVYRSVLDKPQEHPDIADDLAHLFWEVGHLQESARLWLARVAGLQGNKSFDELNRAGTLQNAASVLNELGRNDESVALLKQSEEIWRKTGYRRGLMISIGIRWVLVRGRGSAKEELLILREQEALARELGDRHVLALNFNNQGLVTRDLGDLDAALDLFRQSERCCRELGDLESLQNTLVNQSTIYLEKNDLDAAHELLKEHERLCRQSSYRKGVQASLCNQAIVLRRQGKIDEAERLLQMHESLCRDMGYQPGLVISLVNQGHVLRLRRQFDQALERYREAGAIARRIGDLKGIEVSLGNQAHILEDKLDNDGALRIRYEQEKICRQLDMPFELAQCLVKTAELLGIPLGRPNEAKPVIEEAENLARIIGLDWFVKQVEAVKQQNAMAALFG